MSDTTDGLADLAGLLHRARGERSLLDAERVGTGLSISGAYSVQDSLTRLRLSEGRCHVGYKLGYTSAAMRQQMNVSAPNYGPLLDDMVLHGGDSVRGFLHPRVEPEVGIVLSHDLCGPGLTLHEIADAVGEVRACLEVVDSIWQDYRFSAEQNTADGSSAAGVVIGPALAVDPLRCHQIDLELLKNDVPVTTATSSAASGHPLHGVAWLAAQLWERGERLRAGELVITGGLTAAIAMGPGSAITARFGPDSTVTVVRPSTERDANQYD